MAPPVSAPPRPSLQEETRSLLRNRVLDAVGELLDERAWRDVTMAEVATRAGVSRQTLYNEFGARQELAEEYVMRETERFLAEVEVAVERSAPDARLALESAFETFLLGAARHPALQAVASNSEGGEELLALLTTRGGPVLVQATLRLAAALAAHWPQLEDERTMQIAETLVRLAISHAALASAPPAATARSVAEMLGPFVDEALADG